MKTFKIALVRWPHGLAGKAEIKTVEIEARTKKEAVRKAKKA